MASTQPLAAAPTVVVIGGHGFFGKWIVDDLLASTAARVVVAGRRPERRAGWGEPRVTLATLDQHDAVRMGELFGGVACVIHAAGPYQRLEPSVLRACLAAGVPYIDLADDRDFVQRAERLVASAQARSVVVLGMSFVPGLCASLVDSVRHHLASIERIRCVARPGSRGSRGPATLRSLLGCAGRSFQLPSGNRAWGWSAPRRVDFPASIGSSSTYLAVPVADFDLFPRWFGCREVEFRACSDQAWLDRALWLGAWIQRHCPVPLLLPLARPMASLVRIAGVFGTDAGAGVVELEGAERSVRAAVVADEHGERLPALPASIAAAELLSGRLAGRSGLVATIDAVPWATMLHELDSRGISSWMDLGEGWSKRELPAL